MSQASKLVPGLWIFLQQNNGGLLIVFASSSGKPVTDEVTGFQKVKMWDTLCWPSSSPPPHFSFGVFYVSTCTTLLIHVKYLLASTWYNCIAARLALMAVCDCYRQWRFTTVAFTSLSLAAMAPCRSSSKVLSWTCKASFSSLVFCSSADIWCKSATTITTTIIIVVTVATIIIITNNCCWFYSHNCNDDDNKSSSTSVYSV